MNIKPTCMPPAVEEIEQRVRRLQEGMLLAGMDYYLCHNPDNIFYLTNFANFIHERPFILLVPLSGVPVFLMPKLEKSHVQIRSVGPMEHLEYFEYPAPAGQSWADRLREVLQEIHNVGVEPDCPINVTGEIPGEVIVQDIPADIRQIKSEYEINRLAYASQLMTLGHAVLLENARPGVTPLEIYVQVNQAVMAKLLSDNPRANLLNTKIAGIVQPTEFSHDPHNFTDSFSVLNEGGPNVTIVSGLADGYGAELERTFFIGSVPDKALAPFNTMLEARQLSYELLKPGACMSGIDQAVKELLVSRGFGENLLHRTGHSFGVTNHEGPFLAEGYEHEVQPGMVFSIEPGIYVEELGGFRFSDTVLVTDAGPVKLTEAPETLGELTLSIGA